MLNNSYIRNNSCCKFLLCFLIQILNPNVSFSQVIELPVGGLGTYLYTPSAEYPYIGIATGAWDNSEAPDVGFDANNTDRYSAHIGIRRAFSGLQKIKCYYTWYKVSSRGGMVASPVMVKTWYIKCTGGGGTSGYLDISPTQLELEIGQRYKLGALYVGSEYSTPTWTSSNPSVVSMSAADNERECYATAKAVGSAVITVQIGTLKATCAVTVKSSEIKINSITLNTSNTAISTGDTKQLSATISPSNATNKSLSWTSSNTTVATVSSTGLVTAKSPGTSTITCKATDGSGVYATCDITVRSYDIKVSSIALNANSVSMSKGDTKQLSATVSPNNATNKSVSWLSSNTTVATVSSTGLVTALNSGSTTITCKSDDGSGVYATCSITVTDIVHIERITLDVAFLTLPVGGKVLLVEEIYPDNATEQYVTWSSSDESVAKVDYMGNVTAMAEGTATITCHSHDGSGKQATCSVRVVTPNMEITNVTIENTDLKQTDELVAHATVVNWGETVDDEIKTSLFIMDKDTKRTVAYSSTDIRGYRTNEPVDLTFRFPLSNVPEGDYYASVRYYNSWGRETWLYYSKFLYDIVIDNNPQESLAMPEIHITEAHEVTFSCSTAGAKVLYDFTPVDEGNSTMSGTFQEGIPIVVECNGVIRARSYKDGVRSEIAYLEVDDFSVSEPVFKADYTNHVAIICEDADEIYYTMDGTEPTPVNGIKYDGTSFDCNKVCTIKAIGLRKYWNNSEKASFVFVPAVTEIGITSVENSTVCVEWEPVEGAEQYEVTWYSYLVRNPWGARTTKTSVVEQTVVDSHSKYTYEKSPLYRVCISIITVSQDGNKSLEFKRVFSQSELDAIDGITDVNINQNQVSIFDISGRQVKDLSRKGIYIINGHKVLIK